MKTSVYIIKIFLVVTIVSALIALPLSYYQVNCGKWGYLWGNAIFIGVFASSLVALICEYIRYLNSKKEIEINSYKNLSLIYVKLKTIVFEINNYFNNPELKIVTPFMQPQKEDVSNCLIRLSVGVDTYFVLKENTVTKSIKPFKQNTCFRISSLFLAFQEVDVAINEDIRDVYVNNLEGLKHVRSGQIDGYEEQQPHITVSSPHTNKALQKVVSLINDELFDSIESFLFAISQSKSNNFDWGKDKERILKLM